MDDQHSIYIQFLQNKSIGQLENEPKLSNLMKQKMRKIQASLAAKTNVIVITTKILNACQAD